MVLVNNMSDICIAKEMKLKKPIHYTATQGKPYIKTFVIRIMVFKTKRISGAYLIYSYELNHDTHMKGGNL